MKLASIEIVEDRTRASRCDEGFLRVSRLRLRNVYDDGSRSPAYDCDVVSRPGSDAVVAVLFDREAGRIRVLLREGFRAPAYLRRFKSFIHPDERIYLALTEVVAGLVEASDPSGEIGLQQRAAAEAREEAGLDAPPASFRKLGGESFASPGTSDEKVYFCAACLDLDAARAASGDGSPMEAGGRTVIWELGAAITACRLGEIPDMKTEVALLRLADHVGYVPQLDCFLEDLPPELRARHRRLGVSGTAPGNGG